MVLRPRPIAAARGFTLFEVLVSLLVFSLGVLALVSVQATAVRMGTDARNRATATFLADQLMARMLISNRADASNFAHLATVGAACAPSGTASTHPQVVAWLQEVADQLPGAASTVQQVRVDAANGVVTVSLCWQLANEAPHTLTVTNQVQWP